MQAAPTQPDILLIVSDQMRGDCLSLLNHPVVRTPNLDALAQEGALFRRAYSTVPSCIPARYSLLTGLFPQTSGVVGFRSRPIRQPVLPALLRDAGYHTVFAGRHMHQVPYEDRHGYEVQVLGTTYMTNDDYDVFLKKSAPETKGIRQLVSTLRVSYNGWEAKPWSLDEELHPTTWTAIQARKLMVEAPMEHPLFLTASFFAPHPPLFPPKRLFDTYRIKSLPPVAHGDWVDWNALTPKGDAQGHRVRLEGETLKATQAGYFGLIEHLDEQLGPLITEFKLRSEKTKRPWIIVFTSDHGEMLGDHGYFRKCEPYEGSANIPFIVAGAPALGFRQGLRGSEPVCLEDIMPTLLQLGGRKQTEAPANSGGISLVSLLRGEQPVVRKWLHFEHADCYSKEQAFQALTDGHYKYIWRPLDGSEQLFNLDNDIHEEHDLSKIELNQENLKYWRATLVQRLSNRPEGFVKDGKLVPGRPYPPLHPEPRSASTRPSR